LLFETSPCIAIPTITGFSHHIKSLGIRILWSLVNGSTNKIPGTQAHIQFGKGNYKLGLTVNGYGTLPSVGVNMYHTVQYIAMALDFLDKKISPLNLPSWHLGINGEIYA